MMRKCHYCTLAGIDPLLLIAERMGKTLDHADDLSEDIHKYGPEALEDVNHKIDITDKDTNVGSGAPPPSGAEETKVVIKRRMSMVILLNLLAIFDYRSTVFYED